MISLNLSGMSFNSLKEEFSSFVTGKIQNFNSINWTEVGIKITTFVKKSFETGCNFVTTHVNKENITDLASRAVNVVSQNYKTVTVVLLSVTSIATSVFLLKKIGELEENMIEKQGDGLEDYGEEPGIELIEINPAVENKINHVVEKKDVE